MIRAGDLSDIRPAVSVFEIEEVDRGHSGVLSIFGIVDFRVSIA